MGGRAFLLLFGAVSGCGLVSGLDELGILDGSLPDVTSSTDASEASMTEDASHDVAVIVDASDAGDSGPPVGGSGSVRCGPTFCDGGARCCVGGNGPYSYSCSTDCGGNATAALACDDKSDCTGTEICCLSGNIANCVSSSTACANTLCSNGNQCGNNGKCQAFSAGFGLALQRCQ